MVAAITSDALLKFFVRQMLHELREEGLAKVHASLSGLSKKIPKRSFSSNQIQIVPGFNHCKPFRNNRLRPEDGFFPGQS